MRHNGTLAKKRKYVEIYFHIMAGENNFLEILHITNLIAILKYRLNGLKHVLCNIALYRKRKS